jgi:hypothetical protein
MSAGCGECIPQASLWRCFRKEGFMDSRAPESVSSPAVTSANAKSHPHEGRNFWVLTAYGISGLALFGVLAYYFSDFISH